MTTPSVVVLLLGVALGSLLALGLRAALGRRRAWRDRARCEDVLRYLLNCAHRGQRATPDTLGTALGLSRAAARELIARMQTGGLLSREPTRLQLSPEGERWALHVMRAHRLWERYLTDEANLPVDQVHRAAHRAEHDLSTEQLEALDAHLGHPRHDPHGAPIPSASGQIVTLAESVRVAPVQADRFRLPDDAIPLSEVPTDQEADVIAIDEGCRGLRRRRLLDLGLTAGARVRPELEGPFGDSRVFLIRGTLIALRKEEADQIWVRPAPEVAAAALGAPMERL